MEYIYILSIIVLYIMMILVKKSKESQNILYWGIISGIIKISYNTIIGCLVSTLNIKFSIISILTISNIILSALLGIKIYKDKCVQKYYLRIRDIIFLICLILFIIVIAYKHYGMPFNIKYETTDPAIHYMCANDYAESQRTDLGGHMPTASINTGIWLIIFSKYLNKIDLYYIYIIFDLIILFFTSSIFYFGSIKSKTSKLKNVISMGISILFLCGYPLNSMIFGFAYLSVGIMFITALLAVYAIMKNKEVKEQYSDIIIFFINIGLFFSYYFFVPVVYLSLGLFLIFKMLNERKNKNIFSVITKQNIKTLSFTLILPSILGFLYFVLPGLMENGKTIISHIDSEGYIYRDLYSNFLFILPLVVGYLLYNVKYRKNELLNILLIITFIFTIVLLYKGLKYQVSSYYYFKIYFLIWILIMYACNEALYTMIDNNLLIYAISYILIYIVIILVSLSGIDSKISNNNILFNPSNQLNAYTNIYSFNYNRIQSENYIYTRQQIKGIKEIIKLEKKYDNFSLIGTGLQNLWANSLDEFANTTNVNKLQIEEDLNIEEWIQNDEKQYIICLKDFEKISLDDIRYKIIYQNEGIIILKKMLNE